MAPEKKLKYCMFMTKDGQRYLTSGYKDGDMNMFGSIFGAAPLIIAKPKDRAKATLKVVTKNHVFELDKWFPVQLKP